MMQNARHKRAMRQRRDAAIKKSPLVMLDIGSTKLTAIIVQYMAPNNPESAGHSFRVLASQSTKSSAIRYGEIASMFQFQRELLRLMQSVQKAANLKVDYAVACFSGGQFQSYGALGEVATETGEVTERDIANVIASCEYPQLPSEREWLHAMPINFTLDQKPNLGDPRGLVGARLAVDMHMLAVDAIPMRNFEQAIKSTDIELVGVTASPYMTGLAVLSEDEQQRGAVVIDMGGMTTSVAIFYAKQLMFVKTVRIGGFHITNDISQFLKISFDSAERIKTLHSGVEATAHDDRETIDYTEEGDTERKTITRSELIGIIRPRVEEIFEEVLEVVGESGFDKLPNRQFVLAGGCSQIVGLELLAEKFLQSRVRTGRSIKLAGASVQQTTAEYTAATGVAIATASPKDEHWDFIDPNSGRSLSSISSMFNWFRQNW